MGTTAASAGEAPARSDPRRPDREDERPPGRAESGRPRGAGRKVLIIVQNLPVPFDRRVWQEASELAANGYQVSVICPTGRGCEARYERLNGIHIYRHPLPVEARGAWGYLIEYTASLLWELVLAVKVLRRHGFDLIHACNPPDDLFLIGALFKLLGKRFLFDHHDINPELYEAKFGRRGLLYRMMRLAERLTFLTADVSIATNESYRHIATARGRMPPDRVFVVRSGPSLERLRPVPPVPELRRGRAFLVGYVGVMGQQEGIAYLIEAARHIVRTMRRQDVQFALVGGGPALEDMKRLAADRGVAPYVEFLGRVPDARLLEVLSTAEVCVNPDEANPMNDKSTMNKIMEYMALGKPIVQFDLTEGKFSAGAASLYAKPNDAIDLAEKIVALLDDPEKRAAMGRFGHRRVATQLAWPYEAPKLLAAYDAAFSAPEARAQPHPRSAVRRWLARGCARTPMARPAMKAYRSILMVGTHLDSTGGIRAVVRGYLEGGLFERFHVVYVATHRTGGFWIKALMAVSAWGQVAFRLATLDAPLVHVMLSSRASFWRKSVVCLLARTFRRPYLLHVHSGRFVQFYERECTQAAQWLVRDIFSHAALVIALSEEWRAALLRICPGAHIEVLPNAVALQGPACAAPARRDDTLLFLGDMTRAKGIFDLVRALGPIATRCSRVRLVCGGLGEIEEVRRLARELRVDERVICTGWLDSEGKRAELAAATVFILPSYAEGMPMALLEAMSYGLPVIASKVGSIPQVVKDGVNGFLIDPGDVHGLTAAVSRLLEVPTLRESLGAAARATIAAHFSLDTAVAHLASIYRRFGLEPRTAETKP